MSYSDDHSKSGRRKVSAVSQCADKPPCEKTEKSGFGAVRKSVKLVDRAIVNLDDSVEVYKKKENPYRKALESEVERDVKEVVSTLMEDYDRYFPAKEQKENAWLANQHKIRLRYFPESKKILITQGEERVLLSGEEKINERQENFYLITDPGLEGMTIHNQKGRFYLQSEKPDSEMLISSIVNGSIGLEDGVFSVQRVESGWRVHALLSRYLEYVM